MGIILIVLAVLFILWIIYNGTKETQSLSDNNDLNERNPKTTYKIDSKPTERQRMAVFKTLGDLMLHKKYDISDRDYRILFHIGTFILGLTEAKVNEAMRTMNYLLFNVELINQMNAKYQLSFRLMLYYMFVTERTPSSTEIYDVNQILSVIDDVNRTPKSASGLPKSFAEIQRIADRNNHIDLVDPWL